MASISHIDIQIFFEFDWCLCGFSLCSRTGMWGELWEFANGCLSFYVSLWWTHNLRLPQWQLRCALVEPCDPEFRRKRRQKMNEWMSGWLLCCTDKSYEKKKKTVFIWFDQKNQFSHLCLPFCPRKKDVGSFPLIKTLAVQSKGHSM